MRNGMNLGIPLEETTSWMVCRDRSNSHSLLSTRKVVHGVTIWGDHQKRIDFHHSMGKK